MTSDPFTQNVLPIPSFPICITAISQQQAEQMAQSAPPLKQAMIYHNALAIFAVHHYLSCLGFEPDLQATEFQDPLQRYLLNSADVLLPGIGAIECCPVLPHQSQVRIPAETWGDRLVYIAVEIDLTTHQATLLGFVDRINPNTEDIPLTALRGVDQLLDVLHTAKPIHISLQHWWSEQFGSGWAALKELFSPIPALNAYRSSERLALAQQMREFLEPQFVDRVGGYQVIELSSESSIVLVLQAKTSSDPEFELSIEAMPGLNQTYLPDQLKLAILDPDRVELLMARTQHKNRHLQLEFAGSTGDSVIVELSLDTVEFECSITL
ncbi:MAG: DUF1822 family protein [Leptolyngbya sp. Prado105]|nr:DUF1822 family protein [Leptolyngbya sp. Prado105]